MDKVLPKVMVVGISAWRNDATAHTLMNVFSCWDPERLSLVYARADLPDTEVCGRYFQISENDVLKSVFEPWRETGREVYNTPNMDDEMVAEEHARYQKARKKHSYVLTLCREMVWALGHWRSRNLDKFVRDINPDMIFAPVYPVVYMAWMQRYILKKTGKPFVCYLSDDNYSYDSCKGLLSYIHRFLLRGQVRWLSTHCSQMYVIVEKGKDETDRLFGTDSIILTKGVDFSNLRFEPHKVGTPMRFVYTGNLIIGRDKTLALIADILNQCSEEGAQVQFDIYSPDSVDSETMLRLNRGCSKHRGFAPRDQVEKIQRDADVVIFAEALEGKESNAARLSFSTKITDYLARGKCILAVGTKKIAPIDYFIRNDSAIIASNTEELREKIHWIIQHPEAVDEYGRKAFACAKKNHDKQIIDRRLIDTMISVRK